MTDEAEKKSEPATIEKPIEPRSLPEWLRDKSPAAAVAREFANDPSMAWACAGSAKGRKS